MKFFRMTLMSLEAEFNISKRIWELNISKRIWEHVGGMWEATSAKLAF
jgi:hypothetical protein